MTLLLRRFIDLPVGTQFRSNGNDWLKVSTRTGRLNGNGMVFYFTQHQFMYVDEGHFADVTRQPAEVTP